MMNKGTKTPSDIFIYYDKQQFKEVLALFKIMTYQTKLKK